MNRISLTLGASAIALMAAAPAHAFFGSEVRAARAMQVEGETFNHELAREYKSFALYEADRMVDWIDADHFAAKSLAAVNGETVRPESVDDWNLDADDAEELSAARANLVTKLDGGARAAFPALAARAQANFDCWMEQQEEDWQTRHINACKQGFHAAMAAMEPVAAPTPPPPPQFKRIEEGAVVYFDHDSSALRPDAERTLETLARRLTEDREVVVTVTGHADRSGPAAYNDALSLRRAATVTNTLTERGLTPGRLDDLDVEAKGESAPAVATQDGVREPANRRVVVEAYARERVLPKETAELK